MTITEKAAYLKGLMDGLDVDASTKEGKMFHAIVDTIQEIALSVEDNSKIIDDLAETVDMLDEGLSDVEKVVFDDDDDFGFDDDDDDDIYEVTCPDCGETFKVSEDMLDDGETVCPSCGQPLAFDLQIGQDDSSDDDSESDL